MVSILYKHRPQPNVRNCKCSYNLWKLLRYFINGLENDGTKTCFRDMINIPRKHIFKAPLQGCFYVWHGIFQCIFVKAHNFRVNLWRISYPLKVNNRNTRTRCEIWSKLIKTPERCHLIEYILHLVLLFLLLTLNLPLGKKLEQRPWTGIWSLNIL